MNVAVVGTGYVGLVTGVCLAEVGHRVSCIDIDENKIDLLKKGICPIYEPGLTELLIKNISTNSISFTSSLASGIENSEVIFLALPTPPGEDGSADLSYVLKVAGDLSEMLKHYAVIVNKSTVPVGTGKRVHDILVNKIDGLFDVVSNPEFLREGVAVDDFMKPDRIVIGSDSEKATEIMNDLYQPFIDKDVAIIQMDIPSAELTKYAANSYLAARISFMNEIANLCEELGANVDDVRHGMGTDSRIGHKFLYPGIGFGGSCFPKDVQALLRIAEKNDYNFKILKSVLNVNASQRVIIVDKLSQHFKGKLKGKKIGMWGLAFKPNTDDVREAPSHYIIKELLDQGCTIVAHDPEAIKNTQLTFKNDVIYKLNPNEVLDENLDALLIVTEWDIYRTYDLGNLQDKMGTNVIFDGRNIYDNKKMKSLGFNYFSIGRI